MHHGKVRRRFMRKAQIGDAAREYAQLAKRLDHEEIDPQYAAFAHLAAARWGRIPSTSGRRKTCRCEQQTQSANEETAELERAARLFCQCAKERRHLNLSSFDQDATAAVHCLGHAVRLASYQSFRHLSLGTLLCATAPVRASGFCLCRIGKHSP